MLKDRKMSAFKYSCDTFVGYVVAVGFTTGCAKYLHVLLSVGNECCFRHYFPP